MFAPSGFEHLHKSARLGGRERQSAGAGGSRGYLSFWGARRIIATGGGSLGRAVWVRVGGAWRRSRAADEC